MIPTAVTIQSDTKFFGLESGRSTGSSISVTYDLPPGMTEEELRLEILLEKKKLDKRGIFMEAARGSVSSSAAKIELEKLELRYQRMLNADKPEPVNGDDQSGSDESSGGSTDSEAGSE